MTSTVEALQNLYVSKGGALTDSYIDIANGAKVGNMNTIPDLINAIAKIEASKAD